MPAEEDDSQEPRQDVGDDEILVGVDRGGGGSTCRPLHRKIASVLSEVSIEPSLFLFMFGYGLYNVIAQNLVIDLACYNNLKYSTAVCTNLSAHQAEQIEVQKLVATMTMYQSILSSIPGIIVCLFVGPWSDTNGRKPAMLIPMVGLTLGFVVWICLARFRYEARVEWYLLTSIYAFVGGGVTTFLTGAFSHLTDISRDSHRTARIALAEMLSASGFPIGNIISAPLYGMIGYYGIFGSVLVLNIINFTYVAVFLKETRGPRAHPRYARCQREGDVDADLGGQREEPKNLFSLDHIKSILDTSFKRRPNNMRTVLLILIAAMILNESVYMTGSINYLYTRLKFNWTEYEYTVYTSTAVVVGTLTQVLIIPVLSLRFKVRDTTIGVIGTVSGLAKNIVLAFACKWWMMYVGLSVGAMSSATFVVVRSMVSKIVSRSEVGSIFSLISSLDSLIPIIIAPGLTELYKVTIDFFPGSIYLVLGSIFLLTGINFVIANVIVKRGEDIGYTAMPEDIDQDEREEGVVTPQADTHRIGS